MGGVSGHGQKNKPHKSGRHAGRSAREKHAKSKGAVKAHQSLYSLTRGGRDKRWNCEREGGEVARNGASVF